MHKSVTPARRVLAICLLALSVPLGAAPAAERLERFLDGLDSFEARFEQTIETADAVTGPVSGTLYVQRPGRFRWEYDGAEGQLIVADGKRVWLLDRELEQVSHQSQKTALRGTPAQLLTQQDAVEQYFTVAEGGEFDDRTWVELTPRDEESQFSFVRIAFDGEEMSRLEMADKFGQYTRFAFADLKRNPTLDAELFKFRPPSGWDIFQTP